MKNLIIPEQLLLKAKSLIANRQNDDIDLTHAIVLIDMALQAMSWISVEDKLPEEIGFYYAYPTMENKAYPVRYIGNGNWVTLFGEKLWKKPTHWLNIPEPPESEDE